MGPENRPFNGPVRETDPEPEGETGWGSGSSAALGVCLFIAIFGNPLTGLGNQRTDGPPGGKIGITGNPVKENPGRPLDIGSRQPRGQVGDRQIDPEDMPDDRGLGRLGHPQEKPGQEEDDLRPNGSPGPVQAPEQARRMTTHEQIHPHARMFTIT